MPSTHHELYNHFKNILTTEGCSCGPERLSAGLGSHDQPGTHPLMSTQVMTQTCSTPFLNINLTSHLNNILTLFSRFSEFPTQYSLPKPSWPPQGP